MCLAKLEGHVHKSSQLTWLWHLSSVFVDLSRLFSVCRLKMPSDNSCRQRRRQVCGVIWGMFCKTQTVTRKLGSCLVADTPGHRGRWDIIICTKQRLASDSLFILIYYLSRKGHVRSLCWFCAFAFDTFSVRRISSILWEGVGNKFSPGSFQNLSFLLVRKSAAWLSVFTDGVTKTNISDRSVVFLRMCVHGLFQMDWGHQSFQEMCCHWSWREFGNFFRRILSDRMTPSRHFKENGGGCATSVESLPFSEFRSVEQLINRVHQTQHEVR